MVLCGGVGTYSRLVKRKRPVGFVSTHALVVAGRALCALCTSRFFYGAAAKSDRRSDGASAFNGNVYSSSYVVVRTSDHARKVVAIVPAGGKEEEGAWI